MSIENPNGPSQIPESTVVEADAPAETPNDRLGQVNKRLEQIKHQQASVASTFGEMQGAHGAQYTGDIEYATMQRSLLEAEQKKLLKRIDNPNSLRSRLGRLARRH
jgi:hypothetical protein